MKEPSIEEQINCLVTTTAMLAFFTGIALDELVRNNYLAAIGLSLVAVYFGICALVNYKDLESDLENKQKNTSKLTQAALKVIN